MTRSTMDFPNRTLASFLSALIPPAFWLGVWQFGAWYLEQALDGKGNELLLPYPSSVWTALVSLSTQSSFWQSVYLSVARILLGLGIGLLLGSILAVLTCISPLLHRLCAPALRIIRAAPVASFILLVLLWTHRNQVPVVISALMVLPLVWETLSQGIRETDPKLLELAHAYRFSPIKTIYLLYLPTLRPYILTACTTSMGLAWKSGVAAEVLCQPKLALGTEIYYTRLYMEVPELFAWTAVVVSFSLLLESLLRRCLKGQTKQRKVVL